MTKNRKSISFEKDIFKEVADELGIDFKDVQEVYYLNNRFMRETANKTDCTGFNLPFLGKLYVRYAHILDYIRGCYKEGYIEGNKKLEAYEVKKDILKNYYNNTDPKKRAFLKNFMKTLISKMKRQIKTSDIRDIEEIQNNYYYEKTK